jgi:5-methylcytosine-specific restriction protein A
MVVVIKREAPGSVFLLTWNPASSNIDDEMYEEEVNRFLNGARPKIKAWGVGNRTTKIRSGDRFFFLRQGRTQRGIVATGEFRSSVRAGKLEDFPNIASIAWDEMRFVADRIPIETLLHDVPGGDWNNVFGSGHQMRTDVSDAVDELWGDLSYSSPVLPSADFTDLDLKEGKPGLKTVTNYDRDPLARRLCIEHYGYRCMVCDFDFEETYGERGSRFIHVHHLHDLSLANGERSVDPIKDLRPVCANCHAMLHRERPALGIEQLKQEMGTDLG